MLVDRLGLHGLEGARAHVQRDGGALHAARVQRGQQRLVKVQRGRGRGHGAGVLGKHGLVARLVFAAGGRVAGGRVARLRAFDVRRQRHVAVQRHQLVRVARKAQVEKRAVGVGPAAQQLGLKPAGHAQARAGQGLFADLHVRGHGAVGQYALDQQLQLAAAGLFAKQARVDDLRVVEDQQVARVQQRGQVAEHAVHRLWAAAVQQARGAALGRGVLGDQFGGQGEVEIAGGEVRHGA